MAGTAAHDSHLSDGKHILLGSDSHSMPAREVFLIRHGSTHLHETGELLRDDPLGNIGRVEATALQTEISTLDVNIVLCSPLQRALETAIRAFSSRPDVQLLIKPQLREFNMKQREREPLFQRHQGHTMRELKRLFPRAPNTPEILWPSDLNDDDEWWEPHGDYCRSADSTCQTAQERVYAFCEELCDLYREKPAAKVCIVAHETVFRAMTGCPRFLTATVIRATLSSSIFRDPKPVVVQCTGQRNARLTRPDAHPCTQTGSVVSSRHAIIVPGWPGVSTLEAQASTALELLRRRNQADDLVLISCEAVRFRAWIEQVEASISADVISLADACARIVIDPYASSPTENARRCMVRLSALEAACCSWSLHVICDESQHGIMTAAFEDVISSNELKHQYSVVPLCALDDSSALG